MANPRTNNIDFISGYIISRLYFIARTHPYFFPNIYDAILLRIKGGVRVAPKVQMTALRSRTVGSLIRQWDNTPNPSLCIPYTISGPVPVVSLGPSLKVYMANIVSGPIIHITGTMCMYN